MLEEIDEYNSQDMVIASFRYIKDRDWKFLPFKNYIGGDFSVNKRFILVNWIYDVCRKYRAIPECFQETVNLFDRYNSNNLNSKNLENEYQCIIICCYFIVSKNRETNPVSMEDLLYVCDDKYNMKDVNKLEKDILITLGYNINYSSILEFIRWLNPIYINNDMVYVITRYLADVCYLSSISLNYTASKMGSACVFLACLFNAEQNNNMKSIISSIYDKMDFRIEDYLEIVYKLLDFIAVLKKTAKHRSIYERYSTSKNLTCSIFVDDNLDNIQNLLVKLFPEPQTIVEKTPLKEKPFGRIIN